MNLRIGSEALSQPTPIPPPRKHQKGGVPWQSWFCRDTKQRGSPKQRHPPHAYLASFSRLKPLEALPGLPHLAFEAAHRHGLRGHTESPQPRLRTDGKERARFGRKGKHVFVRVFCIWSASCDRVKREAKGMCPPDRGNDP